MLLGLLLFSFYGCIQKQNDIFGAGPVCVCVLAVPEEFMYNPVSRSYGEPHKRPEVQNATIEFIASSEYMVRI